MWFVMKGAAKAILIIMTHLTGIYIGTVVYINSLTSPDISFTSPGVVYGAHLYTSVTPPSIWYTRDQLGIVGIREFGPDEYLQLQIIVDQEKEPFPLQREQPIFLYKDRFFQVSSHWVTPGLPDSSTLHWQILAGSVLGAGWVFVGALFIKWRKKE